MKKLSYYLIGFGVLMLIAEEYVVGFILIGSGGLLLRRSAQIKANKTADIDLSSRLNSTPTKSDNLYIPTSTPATQPDVKAPAPQTRTHFRFNVAGTEYEGRSKLIEEYLSGFAEPYDGMTNKEMKEYDGDTFYKYEKIIDSNAVEFVMEPNNKFDPNAIAVHHNELGKIGYVPAARTATLRKFLEKSKEYTTEIEFYGGPYKRVYDGEIETGKYNYSADVKVITPLKG